MTQINNETDPKTPIQKMTAKLINTRVVRVLANLPPIAWITRVVVRNAIRTNISGSVSTNLDKMRSGSLNLEENLQGIVMDVVEVHGYASAMLATYEQGDFLPIRAFYVDPNLLDIEQVYALEREISEYTPSPVSITDPEIARVNRYNPNHRENLSVRAVEAGAPVITNQLYDLFRPIVPPASKHVLEGFQAALNVKQAIAVPFFLESMDGDDSTREIVGNLFAIKQAEISPQDILTLTAFGRQAAAAIQAERRQRQSKITQDLVFAVQTNLQDEEQILQRIVEGVVSDLGYVGAMVGTYEEEDASIPVRAFFINPGIASMERIRSMEQEVSKFTPQPVSITDPKIARVYRNEPNHSGNLSVQAVNSAEPVTSNELFDLFRPIAPEAARQMINGIQEELGIHHVIAVPFFLESTIDGTPRREIVGNLFAATRSREFSQSEIDLLVMFGQQAAAGLRNARLYRKAEDRRVVAETFGRMAFSATANIQELQTQVNTLKDYLKVLQRLVGQHKFEEQNLPLLREMLTGNPEMVDRLSKIEDLLDSLHEPWKHISNEPTDVNTCLEAAMNKSKPSDDSYFIEFHTGFDPGLPIIHTSPGMLTEALSVLISNAVDAINSTGKVTDRHIWINSAVLPSGGIEISVKDNGTGILPENITAIFEMNWSTKEADLGFGLFWARDFIEGIGGKINVESTWGTGTTFTIQIPK